MSKLDEQTRVANKMRFLAGELTRATKLTSCKWNSAVQKSHLNRKPLAESHRTGDKRDGA